MGEDLADDPQAGLYMVEQEHPLTGRELQIGPIVNMSRTPTAIAGPAPVLGQDSVAVLREAGYETAVIDGLVADGVVISSDRPTAAIEA